MVTRIGRRVLELGVGLFALLGFAFVPLGKKTALEHLAAIVDTQPAREAGKELLEAGDKLRAKVLSSLPRSQPFTRDAGAQPPGGAALVCVEPFEPVQPVQWSASHAASDAGLTFYPSAHAH